MSYTLKKINSIEIEPINLKTIKTENIKGHAYIPMLYSNVFICARKGSGKTTVLFNILKNCINKSTKVVIFCSTHNNDRGWIKIKEWLNDRKQPHVFYDAIFDDTVSNIEMLIEKLKLDAEQKQQNKKDGKLAPKSLLFNDAKEKTDKPHKEKQKAPKYFIVFDDISNELRAKKDVQTLLKHMRHFRSKIVVSSQFPNDLDPASRMQIDFWMMFKGFSEDRLEQVYPQLDLNDMDFEKFYKIYKDVTKEPHHFLYIDKGQNEMRQNFNQQILLK